jgi:hypothetical protein
MNSASISVKLTDGYQGSASCGLPNSVFIGQISLSLLCLDHSREVARRRGTARLGQFKLFSTVESLSTYWGDMRRLSDRGSEPGEAGIV